MWSSSLLHRLSIDPPVPHPSTHTHTHTHTHTQYFYWVIWCFQFLWKPACAAGCLSMLFSTKPKVGTLKLVLLPQNTAKVMVRGWQVKKGINVPQKRSTFQGLHRCPRFHALSRASHYWQGMWQLWFYLFSLLTSFIWIPSPFILASESETRSVVSDSLQPHGLYSPWNSPGQNTGVDSLSLLQGIFPTQGSNPGLPHCRWILYQLSHQGSPSFLTEPYLCY